MTFILFAYISKRLGFTPFLKNFYYKQLLPAGQKFGLF
jgi:hypothetical protein